MKITLKDGSVKEYEHSMSVIDIAKDLSEGLARVATSGRVNGELVDLRTVVDSDSEVEILTFDNEEGKGAFFHTTSHIMAQAIKRLYPETKLAIGPSIENGFYYDVDPGDATITAADFPTIEAKMLELASRKEPIVRKEISKADSLDRFAAGLPWAAYRHGPACARTVADS